MARVLVLTIAIANGAVAIFEALLRCMSGTFLGVVRRCSGSVTSALGVGTILGALLIGRFAQDSPAPRIINAGFLVQAVSVFILGVWAIPVTTLAASVGLGAGGALVFLSAQTFALGRSASRDAGASDKHSYVRLCHCATRSICQQRTVGGLAGIAQPLLRRGSGRAPNRNRCSCLDPKRTKLSTQRRRHFGRELSSVVGSQTHIS